MATVEEKLAKLGPLITAEREVNSLSLRQAAAEIDISLSALVRLEQGKLLKPDSYFKALLWLGSTRLAMQKILELIDEPEGSNNA